MKLVCCKARQINMHRPQIARHPPHPLRCISVKANTTRPTPRANLRDWLHRARLVVGPHHAHQRNLGGARLQNSVKRGHVGIARAVAVNPHHLGHVAFRQRLACLTHRAVFSMHRDHHATLRHHRQRSCDGQAGAFRAATRKDDLPVRRANQLRHRLARQFHQPPRLHPRAVHAGRISPAAQHRIGHRRHHLRQRLRGGVVVQVGVHATTVAAKSKAGSRRSPRCAKAINADERT